MTPLDPKDVWLGKLEDDRCAVLVGPGDSPVTLGYLERSFTPVQYRVRWTPLSPTLVPVGRRVATRAAAKRLVIENYVKYTRVRDTD